MKRQYLILLPIVFALGLQIISFVPLAFAMPNIYMHPSVVNAEPGETFNVEVKISNAADVFGWELSLSWNASILNFTKVTEGPFLKGIEQTDTMMVNQTFQDEVGNDTIAIMATRLGYLSGVDGSGTLATVTFIAERKGETILHLLDTNLADSRPTPFPIEHDTTDGLFSNIAGFPTPIFTFSPTTPDIDETIVFDANASFDQDGSVTGYFWDFADGQNASESIPFISHAFSDGGSYFVSLTVTDNEGWNATLIKEVKVRFTHDIAVVSVSQSHQTVTAGDTVTLTVIVMNEGAETESFTVKVYYGDNEAAPAQTVSNLASGLNRTLTFEWNTENVDPDDYRIKAVVDPVSGEGDLPDNTKLGSTVTVEELPEQPWLLYVGIGAAGVIVIVVFVFFLRRRGKGS